LLEGQCDLAIPESTYQPLSSFFSSWGSAEIDGRSFTFWQTDEGLVLDRMSFDEWLLDSAESIGVTVLRGCKVTGGKWNSGEWIIEALIEGQHQTLNAGFVVEAIGSRTRSAVQPDLRRFFTDTLVCLSIELSERMSEPERVMVESCEVGWWYTVQLPNAKRIVCLFTDGDTIEPSLPHPEWLNSLLKKTSHIRRLVDEFSNDAKVHICDARTSIRTVLWRAGWISVGDAAWSLDPLSGAGIQRAINDGINAALVISRSLTTGRSDQLRAYAVSQVDSFRKSLATQRLYYSFEPRWRNAPFWRRRL
jgi:flavin-dependent dehydrogenase